jgi:hypothetical protein
MPAAIPAADRPGVRKRTMPCRARRWIWVGRAVAALSVAGLASSLFAVGWNTAGQLGSAAAAVVALAGLLTPYLLPPPPSQPEGSPSPGMDRVDRSGNARASSGGQANTGMQNTGGAGSWQVRGSGDAQADGPGSVANTGIQREMPKP